MTPTPQTDEQSAETVMIPLSALANMQIDGYLKGWNDALDKLGQIRVNACLMRETLIKDFTTQFRAAQETARKEMDLIQAQAVEKEEANVCSAAADSARLIDLPKDLN